MKFQLIFFSLSRKHCSCRPFHYFQGGDPTKHTHTPSQYLSLVTSINSLFRPTRPSPCSPLINRTVYLIPTFILSIPQPPGKEQCRTPDSPEGARVVAPRSPISPHIPPPHHSGLVPQQPPPPRCPTGGQPTTTGTPGITGNGRHGSSSPPGHEARLLNGSGGSTGGGGGGGGGSGGSLGSITPPPVITSAAAAAAAVAQQDTAKLLKIRRFLGALVQFGQDTNVDIGDRVRSLVLSLAVSFNYSTYLVKCF